MAKTSMINRETEAAENCQEVRSQESVSESNHFKRRGN